MDDSNQKKQQIQALVNRFRQELQAYREKRRQIIIGFTRKAEHKKIVEIRQALFGKNKE